MKKIAFIMLLLLSSCGVVDKSYVFTHKVDREKSGGGQKSFIYTYNATDTVSLYKVMVFFRHTDIYEYQYFNFDIDVYSPDGASWNEKLSIKVYNSENTPIGYRNVMLYNREEVVLDGVRFNRMGHYNIVITPSRDQVISEITDIGVRIEETN